jgi:hypothetical protein
VLLVPPNARRQQMVEGLARKRTLYLSGWGMDPYVSRRYGVDRVVPFSDHAGYDDLLRYVAESGARRVITVYGAPEFSHAVTRELGVEACHLDEQNTEAVTQMRLF